MSSFTNYQKNVSHSFLVLSQIGSWSLEEAMKEALDSFRVYILFRFLQYCHKKNGLHTNLNTTFDKDNFWGGIILTLLINSKVSWNRFVLSNHTQWPKYLVIQSSKKSGFIYVDDWAEINPHYRYTAYTLNSKQNKEEFH